MKTYLIAGGAGFIGSNFIRYLLNKYKNNDIKIVIVDCLTYAGNLFSIKKEILDERVTFEKVNIIDEKEIERIFLNNNIDYVVNFAAETHVDRSIENSKVFLETNILGTHNLLEKSKKYWSNGIDEQGYPTYRSGVKYLQISTDEVYGSLEKKYDTPVAIEIINKKVKTYGDKFFDENTPLNPNNPYSASKSGADQLVVSYNKTYKLPVNITRCSNNYGAYQFPEKLIPLVIKKLIEGGTIPVYGNGENVRDWIYVEDHCEALDKVINDAKIGEIYNIGGFNEKTNIEIVKMIIDILIYEINKNKDYLRILKTDFNNINYSLITFVEDRLGHDMRYAIDSTKIIKQLGWDPQTDFDTGLRKTVKWYLDNSDWFYKVLGI